ncbi:PREDICTED: uncharacterized protein LOC104595051 isoform X5 [Nelumbo nucifera]|uniref:Uncharacterized protein LOC104595051 isoform X5 n=1 Tax=Nelumbo nucifera TaxID=4432 RepID=A0A1U8Q2P5_NELNU|nr:PREDICTED: uncharacterized protein LOC104595051 isoform X5 [Nelumbo nucifera]
MVNDIQSHKKIKGCDNNHSGRGDIGASIISDFATTDTSALRRLTKQLPSKKKTVLISAITQKSEGLEKQILPTAPVKRRAERVEKKKMPSPVRKSDGNEKQCSLSSSESKKTRNGFSTLDTKREKKGDRCGKKLLFDVREQSSRSEELTHVSLRKKRLDARSYRALISSQSSLAKELRDGNNIGTRDSIEGKEGAEECTELKGEEQRKQDMAGGGERSTEGSNSGELSSFIQKHKIHPDDEQDSENGDGLAVSKYSHSSLHSSPNGIIGKETVDDAKKDCPAREDLQTSESIESTSEGRLLSADADIGMDEKSGAVKRNAMDMDSDASVAAASKEICSFTADIVSSSPSGGRRGNTIESCSICSKRQRVDLDSRSQVVCSCKQKKKGSSFKLSKFPNGVPPGLDNCHLRYVNRLRECWHKDQNALIIDDQERVIRVVLFILSLQPDVCRPFLIISSSTVLSVWEAQFLHVAPSVNVIVYDGSKDVRKTLRSLKFYKEGGCIMFHVLLSPPDAIIEDLEILECLGWEAIIVDECQQYGVAKHLEQIKMLTTGFRLLISRGQVKDSITEQLNLLSFLDPGTEKVSTDGLKGSNMSKLKERLAQFIAFEHKLNSSKFVEYWVPVQLSNVQLEQYCATLLSNSMLLRSNSKNDIVEALRDILISARKCCDHPYLVDQSLQSLLTKGLPETEYLDIGVKASGKLQLLDCILSAIKDRGLRVLILFQEDVKGMAGRFLEYIMNNHRVSREPATILQAFEISLCWAAASLLKYKIDHSDSLERVKQLLNFNCKEEEVEYVYSKLRVLKKVFSRHTENVEKSNLTRIDTPKTKDIAESLLPVMNSQPAASAQQQLEGDIRESSESNNCFGQEVSLKQGHAFKNANGLIKNEFSNNVELVENIFAERLKRLLQKQQEEVQKFNKIKEKEKAELEKQCQVEAVLTRTINSNLVTRLDKLKRLDQEHSRKMEQFSHHMELQQKNLENLLLAARNEEKRMTAHWLEQAKSGRPMEEISKLPLPNIVLNFEKLEASEKGAPISDPSLEKQYPDGNVPTVVGGGAPSRILESVPDGVDNVCSSMGTVNPAKLSSRMDASTMSGGTVPSEIANNVDRGRISMKTLSLTTQSSGMDASIVPDGVVLSKGLETVPNEVHRDSIPMEKFTSTMQTIGLDVTGMSGGVVPFEVLDTSSNEVGRLSIPVETFTPSMQSIGLNIPVVPGGVLPPEVPEEVDESNIPMEVVNPSLQPSRLDGGMCTVASDRIDLAEVEQHTMASSPNNGEISPLELTEIGTSSDHVMSAQGNTLPSSQVLSVEHPGPPISTSVQVEDLGYFDGKNPPQQVKVPALQPDNVAWPDQSNHNILVTSPSMQLQLSPSTDPTSKHNQLDVTLVTGRCEPGKEGGTSCQQAQLQIEDLAQLPNHSVAQPVTDSSPGSLTGTPVGSIGLPVSDPRSMGTHPESSSCQQTVPSGGSEVHILDTISVVTVSESSSCAPSTVPVIPQVAPPFHHDLLQEELKRIHEEKEQTIKIHKDMKVQLQFQCDKEIEEIRKKYSAQLHNADITFMQREKELVVNYNKVLMNQILAKTLRTIDQQVSGVYSSLFQQLLQLPGLQQVQKPPTDAGPSASSPLQVVHHFWELFSSSPVRSQFNPVVPSTGNLQVGTEPQALATHLQTFRPVTSMSVPNPPSIPHLMPTQNFLGNTATTPAPSSMPGPCTVPSQQSLSNPATTYSVQHLFAPHLLTNPLLTRESHQMEIAGALPIFHNTSMSSLDLLMDIDNSHFTSQPQMLQTHLQSNPTMDMPDTSTLVTASGLQGAAASSCTTDVVCLSDDD